MPEVSSSDAPLRNPQYPQGAEREDFSWQSDYPPPHIYGTLPRSRAKSFGRTIGSAVGNVIRFPQRVGQAGSRLRQASNIRRANASAAVLEMMDTAAQRAENLRRTAGDTLSGWARDTRYKAARFEGHAVETWHELRSSARGRLDAASRRAAAQWNDTQRAVSRMPQEDPVRFLAIVAGTAFVIGAGLRIWRSSSNE